MQEKIAELKKIDGLQDKAAENATIIDAKREAIKEQNEAEIDHAKQNIKTTKQSINDNVEEAKLATLEAVAAQIKYYEKYNA